MTAQPHIVIACGGTGGHLYPGLAVGERLLERGAAVTLAVSAKEIDQQALRGDSRYGVLTLPAVGFSWRRGLAFARGCYGSWRQARREFRRHRVGAFLSMGGFTSAPAAVAAHGLGAPVFLHEANAVPGRANRWLARIARGAFVYFPEAGSRLSTRAVRTVGMPVRRQIQSTDAGACRMALGLGTGGRVLLVTGGSQGASGVNGAVEAALPALVAAVPGLQVIHLTGPRDEGRMREAYARAGCRAVVRAFLTEMDLALGAADAAIARAGASSAAELAAVRLPAVLVPYPHATDGHQEANARALERSAAACVLTEREIAADPERWVALVVRLLTDEGLRGSLREGLAAWHRPDADDVVAEALLSAAAGIGGIAGASAAERRAQPRMA